MLQPVLPILDWGSNLSFVSLAIALLALFLRVTWRPTFAPRAPALLAWADWPVVGALRFFSERHDFWHEAVGHSATGNFSFYIGRKQVVGISTDEARAVFFEHRGLSLRKAHKALFSAYPTFVGDGDEVFEMFTKNLAHMLRKDSLEKVLGSMVLDTRTNFETLLAHSVENSSEWRTTDPFDSLTALVFQNMVRAMGDHDIAEDPVSLRATQRAFELFEGGDSAQSTAQIIFPWLTTPHYVFRILNGARLYRRFSGMCQKRKTEEGRLKKWNDPVQYLIDRGLGVKDVAIFQIGILFAAQVNTAFNMAHLPFLLANNKDWYHRVRQEVDTVISQHRTSPTQTRADVLATLRVIVWQTKFPIIDACLRESIRLTTTGSLSRLNHSNADIPISTSPPEILPKGAYATVHLSDIHMNPEVYTNPDKFDPGRFLPGRQEDKKGGAHAFAGWGSGRHPCLGQKIAEIVVTMILAHMVAMLEWETDDVPIIDRNAFGSHRPKNRVCIRYKARVRNSVLGK